MIRPLQGHFTEVIEIKN